MTTPDRLTRIRTDYDAAIHAAETERAAAVARAIASGTKQAEIIRATGYSRETVRRLTREGAAAQSSS